MKKIGFIKYYKSNIIPGYENVEIFFDGEKYKISLGLFGEDGRISTNFNDLVTYLRDYYENDPEFKIEKIVRDENSFFQKQLSETIEKEQKQQETKRKEEEQAAQRKQKKLEKSAQDKKDVDNALHDMKNSQTNFLDLNGNLIQKILMFVPLLIVNVIKNTLHVIYMVTFKKAGFIQEIKYSWYISRDLLYLLIIFYPFMYIYSLFR